MKNRIYDLRCAYFNEFLGKKKASIFSRFSKKIYLPCFEIPITTICTLRCKNCSNLIQYYDKPYHVNTDDLVSDLEKFISAIDKIGCVRILGGEPILSPALPEILNILIGSCKVDNILIVTNGTLLFSEDVIEIIKKTKKVKVSISNYGDNSKKIKELEGQLYKHKINFEVRNVIWREKADIIQNSQTERELTNFFEVCPNKFFSLLNGKIYICPKSAHASDLGLIETEHYVDIRDEKSRKEIRNQIVSLVNNNYVELCKYCNEYNNENLDIVISGEQCSRAEALSRLEDIKRNIISKEDNYNE